MVGIPFLYVGVLLSIIWIIYRFVVLRKNKDIKEIREIFINIFFIYFLIVINLTFFKQGFLEFDLAREHYSNLIPLVETIRMFRDNFMGIGNAIYNVLGNILLFMPLGFGIPLFYKNKNRLVDVALYGFIASISIESLQYLTSINITDVDDVIFNTLGAIIGFLVFNISCKYIKMQWVGKIINKITSDYDGKLVFICVKPISIMVLAIASISFFMVYKSTFAGNVTNEKLATEVFFNNNSNDYKIIKDIKGYKIYLSEYKGYLEIKTAKKIFGNRWTMDRSGRALDAENFDYSFDILRKDKKTGIILYGKSLDCTSVEITFNGEKYKEKIDPNSYFIVSFPTFEHLSRNTDIYDVFNDEPSKDLQVKFLEDDNKECTHMKFN